MSNDKNLEFVRNEIVALHDFFTGWFNGTLPQDDALFNDNIGRRLVAGFVNIQPSGAVLERDALIGMLRSGYGKNPEFKITIEDVVVRQKLEGGLTLATYVECQTGAQNSQASNKRLSSVLMKNRGDHADWYWVHETGL